jgi:hypothetical protein
LLAVAGIMEIMLLLARNIPRIIDGLTTDIAGFKGLEFVLCRQFGGSEVEDIDIRVDKTITPDSFLQYGVEGVIAHITLSTERTANGLTIDDIISNDTEPVVMRCMRGQADIDRDRDTVNVIPTKDMIRIDREVIEDLFLKTEFFLLDAHCSCYPPSFDF